MKKLCVFLLLFILCFTACFSAGAEESAAELDGWILDFRTQEAYDSVSMSDFHSTSVSYDEESESMIVDFVDDYVDPQITIMFQESFPSAEYTYMQICAVNTTKEKVWQFFPLTNNSPIASGEFVFSSDSRNLYNQTLEEGFETDVWSLTTGTGDQGKIEGWKEGKKITGMRFDVLNQPKGEGPVYVKYIAFFKTEEDALAFDGTQNLKSLTGTAGNTEPEPSADTTPEVTEAPETTPTAVPTAKPTPAAKPSPSPSPVPTETGASGISTPLLITIIIVAVVLIAGAVVVIILVRKNKKK